MPGYVHLVFFSLKSCKVGLFQFSDAEGESQRSNLLRVTQLLRGRDASDPFALRAVRQPEAGMFPGPRAARHALRRSGLTGSCQVAECCLLPRAGGTWREQRPPALLALQPGMGLPPSPFPCLWGPQQKVLSFSTRLLSFPCDF